MIPKLKTMTFYTTNNCNLKCGYCWYLNKIQENSKIEFTVFKEILTEAIGLGLQSILFTGGEPLLNKDFWEFIEFADKNNLVISLETNGTLVSTEGIYKLSSLNNLYIIATSLDYFNSTIHDSRRGLKGAFDKTTTFIKNIVERKIHNQVIYTIDKSNCNGKNDIIQMIEFCESLDADSLKINPIVNFKSSDKSINNDLFDVEDSIQIERMIHDIKKEKQYGVNFFISLPCAFSNYSNSINNVLTPCDILNKVGLLPNGDISICGIGHNNEKLVAGNLFKQSLIDIWNHSELLTYIRANLDEEITDGEACNICMWKNYCKGFCKAYTYIIRNKWNGAYPLCQDAYEKGVFPDNAKNDCLAGG